MTDETRARFLAGIAAQIPAERVAELHLFGAIRQGAQESGVAVVAVELAEPIVELADDAPPPELALGDAAPSRFTVFTARFRHTLKGPERGKWEMSVTEEADAPLLTVDAVVRGVSRRSGEADETVRMSGDEFRAALPEPART
jgi:hypothetical protein